MNETASTTFFSRHNAKQTQTV